MKFILALLCFLVSAAQANEILYRNGGINYALIYNKANLIYRAQGDTQVLEVKACNKKMVEEFWASLIKLTLKFPKAKDKRTPTRAFVAVDDEYRHLIPRPQSEIDQLNGMSQRTKDLRAKSAKKCAR